MTQQHHSMAHALELFTKLNVSPVNHVIDIGANTGTPFLLESFPTAHHYLVEPLEHLHPRLIANYKDSNYTIFSEPLLDTITPMYLYEYSVTTQEGFCNSSTLDENTTLLKDGMTLSKIITSSTLDNLFYNYNFNKLDSIIKIDVDGNELKILKGGENLLSRIGLVIVECNAQSINNIMSLLHSMGFELFDIVSPGYYRDVWIQSDLIFINQKIKNDNINFRPFDDGPWTTADWNPIA
jgi:FkbM family methyltransferase